MAEKSKFLDIRFILGAGAIVAATALILAKPETDSPAFFRAADPLLLFGIAVLVVWGLTRGRS